jgi:hypothetical protein
MIVWIKQLCFCCTFTLLCHNTCPISYVTSSCMCISLKFGQLWEVVVYTFFSQNLWMLVGAREWVSGLDWIAVYFLFHAVTFTSVRFLYLLAFFRLHSNSSILWFFDTNTQKYWRTHNGMHAMQSTGQYCFLWS